MTRTLQALLVLAKDFLGSVECELHQVMNVIGALTDNIDSVEGSDVTAARI